MSDYEIHEDQILGEGGMGTVCRGRQISLDRPVAIKIIRNDLTDTPTYVERFRKEAALLGQVIDGHVVQVFGAGEWKGRLFYAMEYIEGEDLASRLQRGENFALEDILRIAHGVGRALKAAWKYRIIHRDIKPSNILITLDGRVKVADFGLARSLAGTPVHTMTIAGTAKYISPEQGLGDPVDIRSDIYSLGVVLFELVTRHAPFDGDSPTSVIYNHVHAQPPSVKELCPTVRDDVAALIMRCLSKKPEDRFQDPDELLDAVNWIRSQLDSPSAPHPRVTAPPKPVKRVALLVVASVLGPIFLAALAYASWSHFSNDHAEADRLRKEIDLELSVGNPEEAKNLAQKHFGPESREFARAHRAHRAAQLEEWERRAQQEAGRKNWKETVKAYEVMLEFADTERKEHVMAGLAFFRDLAAAETAEGEENWEKALKIYETLKAPSDHREYVHEAKLRARDELARRSEKLSESMVAEARTLQSRAQWAQALDVATKARDVMKPFGPQTAEMTALLRELEKAAAPPAGFVYVPAGAFPMGADDGARAERPRHRRETTAYYIGAQAVTRGEYAKFLEDEKSRSHQLCPTDEPKGKDHTPKDWSPDLPKGEAVTGVDWFDAVAYSRWAGARLPTEAEWEKAAAYQSDENRSRKYPWGETPSTELKDASFFGAQGMGRGVSEWTQSLFEAYPGSEDLSHIFFAKRHRVLRGGQVAADDGMVNAPTTTRGWRVPTDRDKRVGFRLAKDVE